MRRDIRLHVSVLGLSLAGALMGTGLMLRHMEPSALPIAIVDRGALLTGLDSGLSEDEQAKRIQRFEKVARHLADAGYIVIDRGWVIAAPEEFYVDAQ